jgi:hypothetical protein
MRGVSKFYPNKPTSIEFTLLVGVGGFDLDMVYIQQMLSHKPAPTNPILPTYPECRELDRSININFDAVNMIITGDWWGWAGSIWIWFVFSKGYPINPPLQTQ